MDKKIRQIVGLICAVITYYIIHEGAHFIVASCIGTFKEIKFLGLDIQVDVFAEKMSDIQMGIFCIAGVISTIIASIILTVIVERGFSFFFTIFSY